MRYPKYPALVVILLALFATGARAERKQPGLTIVEQRLEIVDSVARIARLGIAVRPAADGEIRGSIELTAYALESGARIVRGDTAPAVRVTAGMVYMLAVELTLPAHGMFRPAAAWFHLRPANRADERRLDCSRSYSLYVTMKRGVLTYHGDRPDPAAANEPGPIVSGDAAAPAEGIMAQYQIRVRIAGRVQCNYEDWGKEVLKGVPAIPVGLDWDNNDDPNDFKYSPPGAVSSTVTDGEGYYSFDFTFWSSEPAGEIARVIRVYAKPANDGGVEHNGPVYFDNREEIDIRSATTAITATGQEFDVDDDRGCALRYLYRAREAVRALFGQELPRVRFVIDHTTPTLSFFCAPGTGGNCNNNPYANIVFTAHPPGSEVSYHEFGHYFQWAYDGLVSDNCPFDHSFYGISNSACAWREGFAEFIGGAVHEYWYSRELPALFECPGGPNFMEQFLDQGQGDLPAGPQNLMEGAVACFFHNLFDDVPRRAPGIVGDNEDLGYSPERVTTIARYRYNSAGQLLASTHLESFKMAVIGALQATPSLARVYPYHQQSVEAMHTSLCNLDASGNQITRQRPATPTELHIAKTGGQRVLTWNDNTLPAEVEVMAEIMDDEMIEFLHNDEQGFRIWRKQLKTLEPWDGRDGRLDPDYRLVGTVGANVRTWTDWTLLAGGTYSYVVVAYNADGVAIPKAEARVAENSINLVGHNGPEIDRSGRGGRFMKIVPGGSGKLIALASETGVAHQWIAENIPPYVALSGMHTDTLTIFNNWGIGMAHDPDRFSVRCIVSDGTRSDTSAPFFPLLSPRDDQTSPVFVGTGAGFVSEANGARVDNLLADPGTFSHSFALAGHRPDREPAGYSLRLNGLERGVLAVDNVGLWIADHPAGTEVVGNSEHGFTIMRRSGDSLFIDTTSICQIYPLTLLQARGRLDEPADLPVGQRDSLAYTLATNDGLELLFSLEATGTVWDSTWVRDFFIEVNAAYTDSTTLAGPTGPFVSGVGGSVGSRTTRASLGDCLPSPASTNLTVRWQIGEPGAYRLILVDETGARAATIREEFLNAGAYEKTIDVSELASGRYFVVLSSASGWWSKPVTIVR